MSSIGIDFGTTNSSASSMIDGENRMLNVDSFADDPSIMKSVLLFNEEENTVFVGEEAILQYSEDYMQGRFLRSIKKLLSSRTFQSTVIRGKSMDCVAIISTFLRIFRDRCVAEVGADVDNVVLGRPVFFSDDQAVDKLAENRLRECAEMAGFKNIEFQLEPIAAALAFEQTLPDNRERIVLLGDFGGGTSDFTVIKLRGGSLNSKDRKNDILSVGGVYIAGDEFDSCIMWEKLAKYFGRGTTYKDMFGMSFGFQPYILNRLRHWHLLPMLREPKVMRHIKEVQRHSSDPKAISNLITLVEDNLAVLLFREIENAKCNFSTDDESVIVFKQLGSVITEIINSVEFEDMISEKVALISDCVDQTLERAGVTSDQIDNVFLTGGSSKVRSVSDLFKHRFDSDKIEEGKTFFSIAYGLGLMASEVF